MASGVARAPQAPRPRGGPRGWRGPQGPARGPPGRSSRRNPLARGPNKLFAGGPENRRYATDYGKFENKNQSSWSDSALRWIIEKALNIQGLTGRPLSNHCLQ